MDAPEAMKTKILIQLQYMAHKIAYFLRNLHSRKSKLQTATRAK